MTFSLTLFSQKPKSYPDFVSYSPAPAGVKALYTYLHKETESVHRWISSPLLLNSSIGNQLLIVVEPYFIPGEEQMEAYIDFMEAGNTILLLKENPKGMFNIQITYKEEVTDQVVVVHDQDGVLYEANIHSPVRVQHTKEDKVLLSDEYGTVALKRQFGKGSLIVAVGPHWATNGSIIDNDHIPLLLSLIHTTDADTILFDEYSHGRENASTFLEVYPMWFLLLLLQGSLVTVMGLWLKGKRFGPIITLREETVRYSNEKIKALAAWFIKGQLYKDSLEIQADYLKHVMQERWGIPYHEEWTANISHLERKWSQAQVSDVLPFVQGLTEVLHKQKISKEEYLLWSKKIDRLRKEVEYE